MDLRPLPLVDLVESLRARRVSPVELMEHVLARIEATRSTLNSVVALRSHEALRADAEAAGERIRRNEARPLEGVPLGVKDLEDVAGLVTSQGSVPVRYRRASSSINWPGPRLPLRAARRPRAFRPPSRYAPR